MLDIFLQVLPFFALIGLGTAAVKFGILPLEAIRYLTQFVFYFALSAMLFQFASDLPINRIFDLKFIAAYALATLAVYCVVFVVAIVRGCSIAESSIEAHCGIIGNIGFLAIPMLVGMFGAAAATPILLMLIVDLIFFGSLVVAVIVGSRDGRLSPAVLVVVVKGLLKNPMIMALLAGLAWSSLEWSRPPAMLTFISILAAAATPCALFAIGGSLVERSAERFSVALWISFVKLVVHPLVVAWSAFYLFKLEPFAAGILVIACAMPVAGNVFIVASHYNVAPQRVSASILVSTVISVFSLTLAIAAVTDFVGF